jgi:hypothetical protein
VPDQKPEETLSDRELQLVILSELRTLTAALAEWTPLLSALRGNGKPTYVQAAGLARAAKKARRA